MPVLKFRDPKTGAYVPIPGGAKGEPGPSGPPGGVFIGAIIAFGGTLGKVPAGYLPCVGQNVSRLTYAELFAAIESNWGNGDGINTFGLPNGQGRSLVGAGAGFALGTVGGSADQTVPLHSHGVRNGAGYTDNANDDHAHWSQLAGVGDHAHNIQWRDVTVAAPHSGATNATVRQYSPSYGDATAAGGGHGHGIGLAGNGYNGWSSGMDRSHVHVLSIDGAGQSPTNQNLPPWAAVTYVIKF